MDLTEMTEQEMVDLARQIDIELSRRKVLAEAPERIDRIVRETLDAEGIQEGEEWEPTMVGYPEGYRMTHNGKQWESQIRANVWEPGDPNDPQSYRWWKDVTPEPDPEPGTTPEWDPNGHAYAIGDHVMSDGVEYECLQAHTSQPGWAPVVVASLWKAVP